MLLPNLLWSSPKLRSGSSFTSPFPLSRSSGVFCRGGLVARIAWGGIGSFHRSKLPITHPTSDRLSHAYWCTRPFPGIQVPEVHSPQAEGGGVVPDELGERGRSQLVCFPWESTSSSSNCAKRKQTQLNESKSSSNATKGSKSSLGEVSYTTFKAYAIKS